MILIYIFIIGLPAILLFFAVKKIVTIRAIEKKGVATHALIINVSLMRSGRNWWDKLKMEYADSTGTRHAAKATTLRGHYKIGYTMPLKYLYNKPAQYAIDGMQRGQWVLVIVSFFLQVFSIYAAFKIDAMVQYGNFQFSP